MYPVEQTAKDEYERDDLFVCEEDGEIPAAAIINQTQVDVYADGKWTYPAKDEEVMVLPMLVVDPQKGKRGIGKAFVAFYEQYATENGCKLLRMDTNEKNVRARVMYKKLGYNEADIVPCEFNRIPGVQLVLLEKRL